MNILLKNTELKPLVQADLPMLPDIFQLALVMQYFMDDIQDMMNCFGVVGRCGEGIRTPRSQRSLKFIKEWLPILAHLTTRKDEELHVLPIGCWATTFYPTPAPSSKCLQELREQWWRLILLQEQLSTCSCYREKKYILLLFKIILTSSTLLKNSLSFHFFITLRMTFLQSVGIFCLVWVFFLLLWAFLKKLVESNFE